MNIKAGIAEAGKEIHVSSMYFNELMTKPYLLLAWQALVSDVEYLEGSVASLLLSWI